MGILNFLTRLSARKTFKVNPVDAPTDGQMVNNNPAVYADQGTEGYIRNGYAGNGSVYTIVSKAAKKFGHINRGLYKVDDPKSLKKYNNLCKAGLSTKESLLNAVRFRNKAFSSDPVNNKLADLIARPNRHEGQDAFFEKSAIFYKAAGETFIWLNRGDVDDDLDDMMVKKLPVLEMYNLPPGRIELIPDLNDPFDILGYYFNLYGAHGARWFIRKCDIIHWKKANPVWDDGQSRSHLRGLSPLKPGLKELTQDDEATDAGVAMFQNGGAKAVIFEKSLKGTNPTQNTQLQEVMDRKVNNNKMKAAVAAIQGDWGSIDLGLSGVDMQLIEAKEAAFTKLCHVLDVPAALFLTDQTYENKSAAIKDWLLNSVIPDACSLRDEMNRVLLPAFNLSGQSLTIDNDISDIPELQEDLGKLVTWMALMPWLTPNEKREYLGEDPLSDPDMDEIWIPNNLVKMVDAGMPDVAAGLDAQGMNDYNQATKPAKTAA